MTNEESIQSVGLKKAYSKVFIFPIQNALDSRTSVYEATRWSWHVSEALREEPFGMAIGIKDKTSQGIFEITGWHLKNTQDQKHWEFDGIETAETESLYDIDWSIIINKAAGYWGFGNYLVVEIDDDMQFRFIKGSRDKSWFSLQ
ncbi:hypothetical protein KKB43_06940 [Patescibacteria group bacterium]|nr:hypothetical protein [Patescibacteria group bacterium]MBU4580711.1 hypothetical protein [Patescibacteria group bacterium]